MLPELFERICAVRNQSDMLLDASLSLRAESLSLRELAKSFAGFRKVQTKKRSPAAERSTEKSSAVQQR